MIKVKALKDCGVSIIIGSVYEARLSQKGWYAVTDESGDEYAYAPEWFELVENEVSAAVRTEIARTLLTLKTLPIAVIAQATKIPETTIKEFVTV